MARPRSKWLAAGALAAAMVGVVWLAGDPGRAGRPARPDPAAGDAAASLAAADHGGVDRHAVAREATGTDRRSVAIAGSGACRVRFVTADDGRPLVDDVAVTVEAGAIAELTAVGGACALACDDRPLLLTVRAPGHVTARGRIVLGPGDHVIALRRAGEVRARCATADGDPVADVGAVLLPPSLGPHAEVAHASFGTTAPFAAEPPFVRDGDRWLPPEADAPPHDGWRARSDASGTIVWSGVRAAAGYRWALVPIAGAAADGLGPARPRHHGTLEPPHERQRFVATADGVEVRRAPPPDLSGRFDVAAGEVEHLAATIHAPARVTGRIAGAEAFDAAGVKLYRIRTHSGGASRPVTAFDLEAATRTDARGAFAFDDVSAGVFVVRACWRTGPTDVHFANQTFGLGSGDRVDLGTIGATAGRAASVTLTLADAAGSPVAAERVFQSTDRSPSAQMVIELLPDSGVATELIYEAVTLPFGRRFVLHGLPPGRLALHTLPAPGCPELHPGIDELEPPARHVARTEDLEPVELRFVVREGFARRCRAVLPNGAPVPLLAVWVRPRAGGEACQRPLRGDGTGSTLVLAAGDYDLWCTVDTGGGGQPGYWATGRATFGNGETDDITLVLETAAAVRLTLEDGAGSPLPGATVGFAPGPGWPPIYAATTDARGEALLTGLPPGRPLTSVDGALTLPPAAAGGVRAVTLRAVGRSAVAPEPDVAGPGRAPALLR